MSKKNSSVNLKNGFKDFKDLSSIFINFKNKLNKLRNKSYVVAVSGGPDSLALAALTKAYSYVKKSKFNYVLIDHNIRKNSAKEARQVKSLLKKHQIPLNIFLNKKKIEKNIQSQAREVRYEILTSYCRRKKINTILTAHNLEDQVETFFIRLSRGSGLHGLSSMKEITKIDNNITLARPMLGIKKNHLIKISKVAFGKYFKDPSNNNTKFLRTRIRKLKKILEKSGINYDQIFKSIKNLASSRDTLDIYFGKIYKNVVSKKKNKVLINSKILNDLNEEMKMRVFKKSIQDFTNSYYATRAKKIFQLIHQIESTKKAKFTLGGCLILREKNHIILRKENKS